MTDASPPSRRAAPWSALLLAASACAGEIPTVPVAPRPTPAAPVPAMSEAARGYLDEIVAIMQRSSVRRLAIDWPAFRARVLAAAPTAQRVADTRPAIQEALTLLGDGHSAFFPTQGLPLLVPTRTCTAPAPPPPAALPPTVGYVRVEAFSGGGEVATAFARQLQDSIRARDRDDLVGWIVDLRGNGGGNMYPMVAGVGPILGDGLLGHFGDPGGAMRAWGYRDGAAELEGRALEDGRAREWELLFESRLHPTSTLVVLDLGTGRARTLPTGGMPAGDPSASPDGSRIAFVSRRPGAESDVWVINRDGTGLTRLTDSPARDDQPAWSPDGRRIAFRSFRSGPLGDVWVMDADGRNAVNLTPDPGLVPIGERDPAWSPDGARLAYASGARPCARSEDEIDAEWGLRRSCPAWSIWTMAADGSDQRRLTTGTRVIGSGTVWAETAVTLTETMPTWSPDGTTIAFSITAAGGEDLVLVHAAGGASGTPLPAGGGQGMGAWTPDGAQLLFVHQLGAGDGGGILAAVPGAPNPSVLVKSDADLGVWNPTVLPRR